MQTCSVSVVFYSTPQEIGYLVSILDSILHPSITTREKNDGSSDVFLANKATTIAIVYHDTSEPELQFRSNPEPTITEHFRNSKPRWPVASHIISRAATRSTP